MGGSRRRIRPVAAPQEVAASLFRRRGRQERARLAASLRISPSVAASCHGCVPQWFQEGRARPTTSCIFGTADKPRAFQLLRSRERELRFEDRCDDFPGR